MIARLDQEFRQRVVITLLGTVAVVTGLIAGTALLRLRQTDLPTPPPVEVEASVIEWPAPPPLAKPALPQPQMVQSQPPPKAEPLPLPKPVKRAPPPISQPHPTEPRPTAPPTQVKPPKETPPPVQRDEGLSGDTSAARAIIHPVPVLPPELRRHAVNLVAVVRFAIAADGSASAELEEATPDPQINQLLLDTFRRWRFFPATEHGQPVGSIVTLRVPVTVE